MFDKQTNKQTIKAGHAVEDKQTNKVSPAEGHAWNINKQR